jgi:hypothetical protein
MKKFTNGIYIKMSIFDSHAGQIKKIVLLILWRGFLRTISLIASKKRLKILKTRILKIFIEIDIL